MLQAPKLIVLAGMVTPSFGSGSWWCFKSATAQVASEAVDMLEKNIVKNKQKRLFKTYDDYQKVLRGLWDRHIKGEEGMKCKKRCCTMSDDAIKLFGKFYGYKSCCVDHFLTKRKQQNGELKKPEFHFKREVLRFLMRLSGESKVLQSAPHLCDTCCDEVITKIDEMPSNVRWKLTITNQGVPVARRGFAEAILEQLKELKMVDASIHDVNCFNDMIPLDPEFIAHTRDVVTGEGAPSLRLSNDDLQALFLETIGHEQTINNKQEMEYANEFLIHTMMDPTGSWIYKFRKHYGLPTDRLA